MTLKPIKNQIIAKMNPIATTPSGLVLPDAVQKKHEGIVVAVGPSVEHVKVGDTITKFFSVEGEKYIENGIEYTIFQEDKHIEFVDNGKPTP